MSDVFPDLTPVRVDLTLVEAVELLRSDIQRLRTSVEEVRDDYLAAHERSMELAKAQGCDLSELNYSAGLIELSAAIRDISRILTDL